MGDFRLPPSPILAINCSGKLAASWALAEGQLLLIFIYSLFCRACFKAFTFFDCLVFVYFVNKNGVTFVTPPSPILAINCSGKLAASFRLLKASYFWLFCRSCFETFTLFDCLVFVYFRKQKWSDFRHSTFTNPRN